MAKDKSLRRKSVIAEHPPNQKLALNLQLGLGSWFRICKTLRLKIKRKTRKLENKAEMGGVKNIWNAMEVAQQTSDCSTSQIHSSSLSVDPSLPLAHITPLIMSVSIFFFISRASYSFSVACFSSSLAFIFIFIFLFCLEKICSI